MGVEHLASFTYGTHPALIREAGGSGSPVELAIHYTDTVLTLGDILGRFWPDTKVIPEFFSGVVEVGLSEFSFKTGYSELLKEQVIQVVKIALGVTRSDIKILGEFTLGPHSPSPYSSIHLSSIARLTVQRRPLSCRTAAQNHGTLSSYQGKAPTLW